MGLVKVVVVFVILIVALKLKLKLWQAMCCGIAATILLFGIPVSSVLSILKAAATSRSNLSLLLMLYFITFLQRLLEKRDQLRLAQQDLNAIFNNRRVNATLAPVFIGLLPSAAAAIICGSIVDEATGDDIDVDEKAFITSYFRHIPESFLPTYTAIILMSELSGVPLGSFSIAMFPFVVAMFFCGYLFYVRKIGKETGTERAANPGAYVSGLLKHLWTLIAIIILILAFKLNAYLSIGIVTVAAFFIYGFHLRDLPGLAKWAFEPVLIVNSALVLIFKEFISYTDVMGELPEFFGQFPIPMFFILSIIFFCGALVCGSQATVAFFTTAAFSAMPEGGAPLMVLLYGSLYLGMQLTPVHICLTVIVNYFKSTLGGLVRKTIPVICVMWPILILYYCFLKYALKL